VVDASGLQGPVRYLMVSRGIARYREVSRDSSSSFCKTLEIYVTLARHLYIYSLTFFVIFVKGGLGSMSEFILEYLARFPLSMVATWF
jgi:hypothetical protein